MTLHKKVFITIPGYFLFTTIIFNGKLVKNTQSMTNLFNKAIVGQI